MYWRSSVTVTAKRIVDAILINAALAVVAVVVANTRPKISRVSVLVIPPGIGDAVKFKWGIVTVILKLKLK